MHGIPGGENNIVFSDGSVRYLSIREGARLQTFPDEYIFQGAWTQCFKQLGNGVPVKLARLLGESINEVLLKTNVNKKLSSLSCSTIKKKAA